MKKLIKKSVSAQKSFANFSNIVLNKQQQKLVKGGKGNVIIIEDLIDV